VRQSRASDERADPASIELLILDVDGVLTDGRLYYGPRGEALKVFDVKDGYGIRRLLDVGVQIAIISGRDSPHVKQRAKDLGIRYVFQGVSEKLPVFEKLRERLGLDSSVCACVGDDRPDVPVMRTVGLAFAVFDAHPAALKAADMVTPNLGGRGAVRNVCDLLVAARQHASRRVTRKKRQ
jgi:3-deoxy-D-manno-octulosonate 8-phosphate phosphatase (KDO 8-P phosphatase)